MITNYEVIAKYLSLLKADISAKNVRIKYYEAYMEYIDTHPDEFYLGHSMVKTLALNINSLRNSITELESELSVTQQKFDNLIYGGRDIKHELEDHKTISEE